MCPLSGRADVWAGREGSVRVAASRSAHRAPLILYAEG